ncbi:MAG: hypothetical protein Q4B10_04265 [Actinomycetaceae bacterium]|nr:hypothetical protein [Actinomycetaceae bacterium]
MGTIVPAVAADDGTDISVFAITDLHGHLEQQTGKDGTLTELRSRHLALRHLGLTRKVVVLDEVHALDAYMDEYLTCALKWRAASGVSVVALSATLTPSLRNRLAAAYREGFELTNGPARVTSAAASSAEEEKGPVNHSRVQGAEADVVISRISTYRALIILS